jgi:hypothetical protein
MQFVILLPIIVSRLVPHRWPILYFFKPARSTLLFCYLFSHITFNKTLEPYLPCLINLNLLFSLFPILTFKDRPFFSHLVYNWRAVKFRI